MPAIKKFKTKPGDWYIRVGFKDIGVRTYQIYPKGLTLLRKFNLLGDCVAIKLSTLITMYEYGLLYTNDNKNINFLDDLDDKYDSDNPIKMSDNEQRFVQYLKRNEDNKRKENSSIKTKFRLPQYKIDTKIETTVKNNTPITEEEKKLKELNEWSETNEGAEAIIRHYVYDNLIQPKEVFLNDNIYSKCMNLFQKNTCKSCYKSFLNQEKLTLHFWTYHQQLLKDCFKRLFKYYCIHFLNFQTKPAKNLVNNINEIEELVLNKLIDGKRLNIFQIFENSDKRWDKVINSIIYENCFVYTIRNYKSMLEELVKTNVSFSYIFKPNSKIVSPSTKKSSNIDLQSPKQSPDKTQKNSFQTMQLSSNIKLDLKAINAILKEKYNYELVECKPGCLLLEDEIQTLKNDIERKIYYDFSKRIKIIQPFAIGIYPVTQNFYKQVIFSRASRKGIEQFPITRISWNEAKTFCDIINEKFKNYIPTGFYFDLPTEFQWEYACYAGVEFPRKIMSYIELLNNIAWYKYNSKHNTHEVGKQKPNAWGIYDMLGNVWEWCRDNFSQNNEQNLTNTYENKTIKGGSISDDYCHLHPLCRSTKLQNEKDSLIGFRIALVRKS